MERFKRKMKVFMGALLSGVKMSLACTLIIFCIACAVFTVLGILTTYLGETTWKYPATFAGMGILSGTLCAAIFEMS